MVLDDYHGPKTKPDNTLTEDSLVDFRKAVQASLAPRTDERSTPVKIGRFKERYQSNKDVMRADDWSLKRGFNPAGLSLFKPEVFPRAFTSSQRRFTVPVADLPVEIQVVSVDPRSSLLH